MRDCQTCIDCGKQSPETDTNYTLISSQFGWRLTRQRLSDGTFAVEWRCPECWREHKKGKGDDKPEKPSAGMVPQATRKSQPPPRSSGPASVNLPGGRPPIKPR